MAKVGRVTTEPALSSVQSTGGVVISAPHTTGRSRWVGWLAVAAGPVTLTGLLLGISLVDWNADAYRDPAVVLALGASKAGVLRVSYLLTALGSYAMLLPLLVWLHRRLPDADAVRRDVSGIAGLAYLLLGA